MFCNHFRMSCQPFIERTPVDRILKDERLTRGIASLQYLLTDGTIALLTGQTGVGKSSLIKLFLQSLNTNNFRPVYLYLTDVRITSLLKLIVTGLGETPKHTKGLVFSQIVDITKNSNSTIVLIIDESQLLLPQALTDIRLLVSSALDDLPPLKIILSGQDHLRKTLRRPDLADLVHRISIKYHLPSLTKQQTHSYIDYQLQSVGASEKIFEVQVKDLIFEFTGGLPRQINNIATACLIQASIQKAHCVDHLIFSQATADCLL